MPAIAARTVGPILAVTEKRVPVLRTAATTAWGWKRLSILATTSDPAFGSAPTAFAVFKVSATSRAAPREEFVEPLRNRAAPTTGAAAGVDTTPRRALRPLTPEYPNPAPCLR